MAQTIIVDTTPGYRMPTIYYSQGDIGRTFSIDLQSRFGESLPASPTITIQATKPSGLGFSVASTSISGAVVTFTVTETMSNEAGRFPAELKIVKNSVTLFTANFYIDCEANAHPEGTTDGDIDHIMPKFMSVTTTTLPAGDSATYSFDANTNTATFGIPKGADGSLASQVLAADYSTSKTYAVGDYVYYSGNLYRCTTAITTAEAWTSGHWTQVALANDVSDVKSALSEITGNNEIQLSDPEEKKYIITSGETVNLTPSVGAYDKTSCAVVECVGGDKFTISGTGGNGARLWAFADLSLNVLSRSDISATETELVLTAPTNAKYLIINQANGVNAPASYKGVLVKEEIENIKVDVANINNDLRPTVLASGDLNDINKTCVRVLIANNTYQNVPNNWTTGLVYTFFSNYGLLQLYMTDTATLMFSRYKAGNTWGEWMQIAGEIKQETGTSTTRLMSQKAITDAIYAGGGNFRPSILESGDLNDISKTCVHVLDANNTYQNVPNNWTTGFVYTFFSVLTKLQIYYTENATLMYSRYGAGNTWGEWMQTAGEIKQEMGTSTTRLMSQKAITDAINSVSSASGMAENIQRRNSLLNAKQFLDIQYTAKEPLQIQGSTGDLPAGTYTGLPYSDLFVTEKYIGFDVSLETFMTSLNNPRSDLYTKTTSDQWSKLIYGIACSTLVAHCYGFDVPLSTAELTRNSDFYEIRPDQIQPCDCLVVINTSSGFGHTMIVEDVEYDSYYMPISVKLAESVDPLARRISVTYAELLSLYISGSGYKVYRYKYLYDVAYTPSKYIPLMNEPSVSIVYNDICASTGDKATFLEGESVTLNVLDPTGYSKIVVTKDGTPYGEYAVGDVTLSNLAAGKYVAKLYPYNDHCETSFIVCDVSASKVGNRITFSGTNCEPKYIVACSINGGSYEHIAITDSDRLNGYKDVTASDVRTAKWKVLYQNEYGRVVSDYMLV